MWGAVCLSVKGRQKRSGQIYEKHIREDLLVLRLPVDLTGVSGGQQHEAINQIVMMPSCFAKVQESATNEVTADHGRALEFLCTLQVVTPQNVQSFP